MVLVDAVFLCLHVLDFFYIFP